MATVKRLAITHSLVFVAGFAIGKYIDYDELSTYRELHESTMSRWRRRAGTTAIGVLCIGTTIMLIKATNKLSSSSSSQT